MEALLTLAKRQLYEAASEAVNGTTEAGGPVVPECGGGNEYDGRLGLRISAVFAILAGSMFGALFPLACIHLRWLHMPRAVYLFARYFGSGVIVATAFIHLLAPANHHLGNACLGGIWEAYDWAPGIAMMSVWMIFLVDLTAGRYVEHKYGVSGEHHVPHMESALHDTSSSPASALASSSAASQEAAEDHEKHISSAEQHADLQRQIGAFLILEFGVLFHSVIIGLALAVAGTEFVTLYVVILFHQTFEGLGLGARLSVLPYRKGAWQPWALGVIYGFVTPLAIAIGIALRGTYDPVSRRGLIVSGVLDALSAGILLYTGLVELLAHDFIYTREKRSTGTLVYQVGCAMAGSALMALLGKWA